MLMTLQSKTGSLLSVQQLAHVVLTGCNRFKKSSNCDKPSPVIADTLKSAFDASSVKLFLA